MRTLYCKKELLTVMESDFKVHGCGDSYKAMQIYRYMVRENLEGESTKSLGEHEKNGKISLKNSGMVIFFYCVGQGNIWIDHAIMIIFTSKQFAGYNRQNLNYVKMPFVPITIFLFQQEMKKSNNITKLSDEMLLLFTLDIENYETN